MTTVERRATAQQFPQAVQDQFAAHTALYLRDPEAAHLWDPIVIGVPGGAVPCLLLHHVGRKSGKRLHSILQYYVYDGAVAIVASKGGMDQHPVWYLNLLAEPACEVQIGSYRSGAVARVLSGLERAQWWARITREQPMQIEYAARTRRRIPIVVLEMPPLPAHLAERGPGRVDAATLSAISHNYALYARACDEKRFDLLPGVFAPDAELAYHVAGHDFSCRGDAAAENFSAFLARCHWTHHLIAHPTVEPVGTRLRASARVTATHLQRRTDGSTNRWLVRGSYHDIFEYQRRQWLIVRRDVYCLDAEGDFEADGVEHFPTVAWAGRDVLG